MLIAYSAFANKSHATASRCAQVLVGRTVFSSNSGYISLSIWAKTRRSENIQSSIYSLEDVIASSECLANLLGHDRPLLAIYGRQILVRVVTLEIYLKL